MLNKIAIVIPCFNAEKTILSTINSVIHQSISNWDLIIHDNNSTDNTVKILEKNYGKLFKKNIFLIKNKQFLSQAENWNRCLNSVHDYKYFKLLCADDTLERDALKIQFNILENSSEKIFGVSNDINYIDVKNNIIKTRSYGFFGFEKYISIFFRNYLGTPSGTLIKTKFLKNKKFSELPYVGDMIFLLDFYQENKKLTFSKLRLVNFRLHDDSSSLKLFGSKIMINGKHEFRYYAVNKYLNKNIFFMILAKIFNNLEKIYFKIFNFIK